MYPLAQRVIPEHDRIKGLILHYRLDNASGDVFDSSPNRSHGTAVGGVTRNESGQLRKSFTFDGIDDEVTNSATPAITAMENTAVFTACFFAKASAYTTGAAFTIRDGSNTSRLFSMFPYWDATIGLRFYWNGTYLNTNSVYSVDNTWHHFCMRSVDATTHEIYVNGVYLGYFSTNKKHSANLDNINVGNWYTSFDHYTGGLDDVRLYDRAITADEILILSEYSS